MNTKNWIARATAVLGAAVMSGCYTYVPVERPAPGSTVRIEVPVRSAVTGGRDQEDVASMEGTLISAGDSIVMEVSQLKEIGNFRQIKSLDTLRVARSDVSGIATRSFSKPKTVALTAIIAGATTVLAVAALGLGGGSQGSGKPGGGTTTGQIRVKPIFSAILHAISH